jgi:hypothetical protein
MIKLLMAALTCTLALATMSIEAGAAASDRGSLVGRTRQGRKIRLALQGDSIQIKRFTIELRCRDGSRLLDVESGFLPTRVRGGRIRDHQVGSTDDVWIRGRLSGRALRGSIRVHDRLGRVQCDSHWVRYRAALRGGKGAGR